MKSEKKPGYECPGVPALAGAMPAGAAAYCQERLIRLKPGLLSGDIWMKHSTFIIRAPGVRSGLHAQTLCNEPYDFLEERRAS
jgi:hypothetical protein